MLKLNTYGQTKTNKLDNELRVSKFTIQNNTLEFE